MRIHLFRYESKNSDSDFYDSDDEEYCVPCKFEEVQALLKEYNFPFQVVHTEGVGEGTFRYNITKEKWENAPSRVLETICITCYSEVSLLTALSTIVTNIFVIPFGQTKLTIGLIND